jgi:hypothetical protein
MSRSHNRPATLFLFGALFLVAALALPVRAASNGPRKLYEDTSLQLVAWSAPHSAIVFRRNASGAEALYSLAATGGTPTALAGPLGAGGSLGKALLSPDGRFVAYRGRPDAITTDSINIVPTAGGSSRTLSNPAVAPAFLTNDFIFSPAGDRLVYSVSSGQDELSLPNALFSVSTTSGTPVPLNQPVLNHVIPKHEVSADGRFVVFQSNPYNANPVSLSIVPIAGGSAKLFGDATSGQWSLSSDGRFLIYAGHTPGAPLALYAVNLDTGVRTALGLPTDIPGQIIGPTLVSDGQHVVFCFGDIDGGALNLYSAPIAGGAARKLNDPAPAFANEGAVAARLADGRALFLGFDASRSRHELFSAPVGSGPAVRLSGALNAGAPSVDRFVVSEDGTRVVFLANQEAEAAADKRFLYSAPSDGSRPATRLAEVPAVPVYGNPRLFLLTPDGEWVIYADYQNPAGNLRAVRSDGSITITLNNANSPITIDPDLRALPVRISPDSRRVVFESSGGIAAPVALYIADLVAPSSTLSDVSPQGGSFTSADGDLAVQFPAGAVASNVSVVHTPLAAPQSNIPAGRTPLRAFTLEARDSQGRAVTQFQQPLMLVIQYSDAELAARGLDERELNLAFWNGTVWVDLLPCEGCSVDTDANRVTVRLDHFTEFALSSAPAQEQIRPQVFLPLAIRP